MAPKLIHSIIKSIDLGADVVFVAKREKKEIAGFA